MKNSSTQTSAPANRKRRDSDVDSLAELGYAPSTDLERLAVAARREYFAAGGRPLSREEIEAEVAERRGGTHLLHDQ